jgi:hypothetical protein
MPNPTLRVKPHATEEAEVADARLEGHIDGVVLAVALADVVQLSGAWEEGVRAKGVKAQTVSVEANRHHPAVQGTDTIINKSSE